MTSRITKFVVTRERKVKSVRAIGCDIHSEAALHQSLSEIARCLAVVFNDEKLHKKDSQCWLIEHFRHSQNENGADNH